MCQRPRHSLNFINFFNFINSHPLYTIIPFYAQFLIVSCFSLKNIKLTSFYCYIYFFVTIFIINFAFVFFMVLDLRLED